MFTLEWLESIATVSRLAAIPQNKLECTYTEAWLAHRHTRRRSISHWFPTGPLSLSLYCTHTAAAPSHAHAFFRSLIFEQFGWPPASKVFSTHSPICKCKCNIYIWFIHHADGVLHLWLLVVLVDSIHTNGSYKPSLYRFAHFLSLSRAFFLFLSFYYLFTGPGDVVSSKISNTFTSSHKTCTIQT